MSHHHEGLCDLGVTASKYFIHLVEGSGVDSLSGGNNSLIVSILSAGTFFGAIIAGDMADFFGRRPTIIAGCVIYMAGM